MTKKIALITILFLNFNYIFSQEVSLFVQDIKEDRHLKQEDSFIELTAVVKGIEVDDLNQIKLHKITAATDSKGNTLKQLDSFFGDDYSSNNQITIRLEAPNRKAIKIASIEGVIKQFSSSESNGSKITRKNPLKYYNKNLLPGKYNDVKLTLIDKETEQKLKEEDEKEYQKEIEKVKKEGGLEAEAAETAEAFKELFEGFASIGSSNESLCFQVDDVNKKIRKVIVYNGKGEEMNYGSSKTGKTLTLHLKEKVASSWRIEILIENPESLKEYNFKISDIALP